MTVLYCGDPHGQFGHTLRAAAALHPSAVNLLGDLELARPMHKELAPILEWVWFIHGNHDTDSEVHWARIRDSPLAARNLHGRVAKLPDGIRIAGLGGVFWESVWHPEASPARAGQPPFRTRAEHHRGLQWNCMRAREFTDCAKTLTWPKDSGMRTRAGRKSPST